MNVWRVTVHCDGTKETPHHQERVGSFTLVLAGDGITQSHIELAGTGGPGIAEELLIGQAGTELFVRRSSDYSTHNAVPYPPEWSAGNRERRDSYRVVYRLKCPVVGCQVPPAQVREQRLIAISEKLREAGVSSLPLAILSG